MKYNPVPRPDRTVIVKNNGYQYVYLTQCVKYSPRLKRSVPSRASIGKLDENGMLIPNKIKFLINYPYILFSKLFFMIKQIRSLTSRLI